MKTENTIRIFIIVTSLIIAVLFLGSCMSLENKTIAGVPSNDTWSENDLYNRENIPVLVKKNDEDFKILLLSDIQISTGPNVKKSLELIDQLVAEVQPELIMTTGDNTAWIRAHKTALKLISQMEGYGIPWGVTLGNHDSEGAADRTWHGNRYEEADNSLFSSGPSNLQGIGNYSINIENEDGDLVYVLIMLDSNVERDYIEGRDYDYIHYDQIRWYKWLVNGFNDSESGIIPSMLFFHIPVPEFMDAYNALECGEIDASSAFGVNREGVFCAPVNTGLFDTVLDLKSTSHIFCGHDHINNSSIMWKGVRLTYGLKTGPSSYSDDDMHGATVITIKAGTNDVELEHIFKIAGE